MKQAAKWARATLNFGRTLWRVILINWRVSPKLYTVQIVMTLVQGLLPLLSAYMVAQALGSIANLIAHPGPVEPVLWLLVGVGLVQFVVNQTSYWSFYLDDVFNMQFDLHVQKSLFTKLHQLDQTYYEDQAFNNQLNKINQNIFSMRSLNRSFLMTANSVVQLTSTGVALFAFAPLISMVITLGLVPILIIEVQTSMRRWRSWDDRGVDWRLAWYFRTLLTNVIDLREIKMYGLRDWFSERWQKHFLKARQDQIDIERRAQRLRAVAGVAEIAVGVGSQIWLLLQVLARGTGLSSFVFYRQMIENYANAGSALVRNLHQMQEESLYVNDYFDLLALKPRLELPGHPVRIATEGPPRIEFDHVSFQYLKGKQNVLNDVSFVVEPGEGLAIVGANGAGKTTLIKLLLRLYDPTSGRILIDGQDLREIDLVGWYRRIGALFQDFNHYGSLTVKDNISVGRVEKRPSDETIKDAAAEAGADDFISRYQHGYEQRLNRTYEDGIEPSGGQWQRIALARAFYREADVLILDEPTSAIDAQGEYEIFEGIARTQRHKTNIIISHRFSTVRNAKHIIVLENGRVTEQGSHDELVRLGGRYQELFELQAAGYR